MSGSGIWPRARYALTVATSRPSYAATSDVVHHSEDGSGGTLITIKCSYVVAAAVATKIGILYDLL
jgi:hypothetical protein